MQRNYSINILKVLFRRFPAKLTERVNKETAPGCYNLVNFGTSIFSLLSAMHICSQENEDMDNSSMTADLQNIQPHTLLSPEKKSPKLDI